MRRDFYCASCKNAIGFPMMGTCQKCENYSGFELAAIYSQKDIKRNSQVFELVLFISILTLFLLALLLGALPKIFDRI